MRHRLIISGTDHARLKSHLLPGDGREAASILLCTRAFTAGTLRLLVKYVHLIPHEDCTREANHITWPGMHIEECLTLAEDSDLSLVLMHSHPGGYNTFSNVDDESDLDVLPSMFLARESSAKGPMFHGSAIMLPDGSIRARTYDEHLNKQEAYLSSVVGDDLLFFWPNKLTAGRPLAFSSDMSDELKSLHAGIVGVSGTGSITAEQILRLGFGEITVVDYDKIEHKNLNRILNSTDQDAQSESAKVTVFERTAKSVYPKARVHAINNKVDSREAVEALAEVDVLFCCVDSETGRDICDRLAAALHLPLFDVGAVIPIRVTKNGKHVIQDVQGRIDYIQPGASSLLSRGVYSPAGVAAEYLRERDPDAYQAQVDEGYMPGLVEEAPSVITLNMRASSMVVQEFIARAYPYRLDGNRPFARTMFALGLEEQDYYAEDEFPAANRYRFASGLVSPLLGIPAIEES